ncbi:uncharacterized protein LOC144870137 [Branchiostoma floridae x Branchiostoma japonicum]
MAKSKTCCCVSVILAVSVGIAVVVLAVFFGLKLVEEPVSPTDVTTTMSTVTPLPTPSGQGGLPQQLIIGLSVAGGVVALLLCCGCWFCRCCVCCYCENDSGGGDSSKMAALRNRSMQLNPNNWRYWASRGYKH